MRMNFLDVVAYLLLILGGINWALTGLFDYNLVGNIFGADTATTNIIYSLIGLSALYTLFRFMQQGSRAEEAEHIARESGHERDREDMRTHPAERIERPGYGTTGRRNRRR